MECVLNTSSKCVLTYGILHETCAVGDEHTGVYPKVSGLAA